MTETKLLTLVQNIHWPMQKKYMGKTRLFVSWCGMIINITCPLITKPHDMTRIDAFSDNIISAEYPDDNE